MKRGNSILAEGCFRMRCSAKGESFSVFVLPDHDDSSLALRLIHHVLY